MYFLVCPSSSLVVQKDEKYAPSKWLFFNNNFSSFSTEHLDFMNALDIDLDIKPFEQLQHASIGYQSLTDVPRAITYSEDSMSFKVWLGRS